MIVHDHRATLNVDRICVLVFQDRAALLSCCVAGAVTFFFFAIKSVDELRLDIIEQAAGLSLISH